MNNTQVHQTNSIFIDQTLLQNAGSGNNTFLFEFPKTICTTSTSKMSVASFSVPYSWFNITEVYKNNRFSYLWFDGASANADARLGGLYPDASVFDVVIPDGFYTLDTLNRFLQYTMFKNGHYLLDTNGNTIYFLKFAQNTCKYRDEIYSYSLSPFVIAGPPNTIVQGYFVGSGITVNGANAFGTGWKTPKLMFFDHSTNLNERDLLEFFGLAVINVSGYNLFPIADHPDVGYQMIIQQGTRSPYQTPVHAVCLTCDYIDNPMRSGRNQGASTFVVTSQSVTVEFGKDIECSTFFTTWIPLLSGMTISAMKFKLTDQSGNLILLEDPDVNIELLLTDLRY